MAKSFEDFLNSLGGNIDTSKLQEASKQLKEIFDDLDKVLARNIELLKSIEVRPAKSDIEQLARYVNRIQDLIIQQRDLFRSFSKVTGIKFNVSAQAEQLVKDLSEFSKKISSLSIQGDLKGNERVIEQIRGDIVKKLVAYVSEINRAIYGRITYTKPTGVLSRISPISRGTLLRSGKLLSDIYNTIGKDLYRYLDELRSQIFLYQRQLIGRPHLLALKAAPFENLWGKFYQAAGENFYRYLDKLSKDVLDYQRRHVPPPPAFKPPLKALPGRGYGLTAIVPWKPHEIAAFQPSSRELVVQSKRVLSKIYQTIDKNLLRYLKRVEKEVSAEQQRVTQRPFSAEKRIFFTPTIGRAGPQKAQEVPTSAPPPPKKPKIEVPEFDFTKLKGDVTELNQALLNVQYGYTNLFNWITTSLGNVIKRGFLWGSVAYTIYQTLQKIKDVMRDIVTIQNKIVQIEKVLPRGIDVTPIAQAALKTARDYGVAIDQVLDVYKMWAQQGKSVNEVIKLGNLTLKAAIATGAQEVDIVKALTVATETFNLTEKEKQRMLDATMYLQSRHIVTTQDLIESLGRVGPAIKALKGGYRETFAFVTAIKTGTMQTGQYISNALRTVMARLNTRDTRKMLNELGVAFRDLEGNVRPVMDIFRDLARVWQESADNIQRRAQLIQTLTGEVLTPEQYAALSQYTVSTAQPQMAPIEKIQIAKQMGGIRRFLPLLVLLENWEEAERAYEESLTSFGEVNRAAEKEVKTLSRSFQSLNASLISLGYNVAKQTGLDTVSEALYNISRAISKLVNLINTGVGGAISRVVALATTLKMLSSIVRHLSQTMMAIAPYRRGLMIGLEKIRTPEAGALSRAISSISQKAAGNKFLANLIGRGKAKAQIELEFETGDLWKQLARFGAPPMLQGMPWHRVKTIIEEQRGILSGAREQLKDIMGTFNIQPAETFEKTLERVYVQMQNTSRVAKHLQDAMGLTPEKAQRAAVAYKSTVTQIRKAYYLVRDFEAAKQRLFKYEGLTGLERAFLHLRGLGVMLINTLKSLAMSAVYLALATAIIEAGRALYRLYQHQKALNTAIKNMPKEQYEELVNNIKEAYAQLNNISPFRLNLLDIPDLESKLGQLEKVLEKYTQDGQLTIKELNEALKEVGISFVVTPENLEAFKQLIASVRNKYVGAFKEIQEATNQANNQIQKFFQALSMAQGGTSIKDINKHYKELNKIFKKFTETPLEMGRFGAIKPLQSKPWQGSLSLGQFLIEVYPRLSEKEQEEFRNEFAKFIARMNAEDKAVYIPASLKVDESFNQVQQDAENIRVSLMDMIDIFTQLPKVKKQSQGVRDAIQETANRLELIDSLMRTVDKAMTEGARSANMLTINIEKWQFPIIEAYNNLRKVVDLSESMKSILGGYDIDNLVQGYEKFIQNIATAKTRLQGELELLKAKQALYERLQTIANLDYEEQKKITNKINDLKQEIFTLQENIKYLDSLGLQNLIRDASELYDKLLKIQTQIDIWRQIGTQMSSALSSVYSKIYSTLTKNVTDATSKSFRQQLSYIRNEFLNLWTQAVALQITNMPYPQAKKTAYQRISKIVLQFANEDLLRNIEAALTNNTGSLNDLTSAIQSLQGQLLSVYRNLYGQRIKFIQNNLTYLADLSKMLGTRKWGPYTLRNDWWRFRVSAVDQEYYRRLYEFQTSEQFMQLKKQRPELAEEYLNAYKEALRYQTQMDRALELQNLYLSEAKQYVNDLVNKGKEFENVLISAFSNLDNWVQVFSQKNPFKGWVDTLLKPLGQMWARKITTELFSGLLKSKQTNIGYFFEPNIKEREEEIQQLRREAERSAKAARAFGPNWLYGRWQQYETMGKKEFLSSIDFDKIKMSLEEYRQRFPQLFNDIQTNANRALQQKFDIKIPPELRAQQDRLFSFLRSNVFKVTQMDVVDKTGQWGLTNVKTKYDPTLLRTMMKMGSEQGVDPRLLYAIGVGEGFNLKGYRYEKHVYNKLMKQLNQGRVPGYLQKYYKDFLNWDVLKNEWKVDKVYIRDGQLYGQWKGGVELELTGKEIWNTEKLKQLATSWGFSQIMGYNLLNMGYANTSKQNIFEDYQKSAERQIQATIDFIKGISALQGINPAQVSRGDLLRIATIYNTGSAAGKPTPGYLPRVLRGWQEANKVFVSLDKTSQELNGSLQTTNSTIQEQTQHNKELSSSFNETVSATQQQISSNDKLANSFKNLSVVSDETLSKLDNTSSMLKNIELNLEPVRTTGEVLTPQEISGLNKTSATALDKSSENLVASTEALNKTTSNLKDITSQASTETPTTENVPPSISQKNPYLSALIQYGGMTGGTYIGTRVAKSERRQPTYVSVGTTVGSLAGSAIAMAAGVPPEVGGIIGSLLGGAIGGLFGDKETEENIRRIVNHAAAISSNTAQMRDAMRGVFNLPIGNIGRIGMPSIQFSVNINNSFGGEVSETTVKSINTNMRRAVSEALTDAALNITTQLNKLG